MRMIILCDGKNVKERFEAFVERWSKPDYLIVLTVGETQGPPLPLPIQGRYQALDHEEAMNVGARLGRLQEGDELIVVLADGPVAFALCAMQAHWVAKKSSLFSEQSEGCFSIHHFKS